MVSKSSGELGVVNELTDEGRMIWPCMPFIATQSPRSHFSQDENTLSHAVAMRRSSTMSPRLCRRPPAAGQPDVRGWVSAATVPW